MTRQFVLPASLMAVLVLFALAWYRAPAQPPAAFTSVAAAPVSAPAFRA